MRVLLVRPPRIKKAIALGEFMYSEPIGLEMVYKVLEDKYEVEIFDMMADNMPLDEKIRAYKPQVIAITSLCIDVIKVLSISRQIKELNNSIVTIVGGTQAYLNPGAFMDSSMDHIMKYSNEKNLLKLYGEIEKVCEIPLIDGVLSKSRNYEDSKVPGVNEYILPNRKSTQKYRHNYSYFGYKPTAIMGTSRGCAKTCRFCLRWRIEGHAEEYFPMDMVKEDIRNIKEDYVMVFDNDFLHNSERINEICNFLEDEKINKKFICYASVHSILENKETVKRFKDNGLVALLVGYETFKSDELEYYEKKSTIDDNLEASRFLKSINVDVWASFMVHPDWTKEDFKGFRQYIKLLSPQVSSFSPLTPFPNLPLYKEYEDRLLVKKDDYESWSFGQITIRPSNMSLSSYYLETLKTNFYINLFTNNVFYMVKKFGIGRVIRLSQGSFNLLIKYLKLMAKNSKS
ncbi:B12-binding domain-containing radical SAM protein [Anaeromicrobium sediminis]|uniref:B12-binding domain-containing radical SAM protein n=1 Tax=Anaeromicrobium sediminis TaxID=1478221 RepID=A0A267MKY6_9FIRM|nr:radical SAM protein [Anaeromicrobium sediminis]PAB60249.1 B12-binding domain-containing radical SAM protein [Anaeromicrobium sediminis]